MSFTNLLNKTIAVYGRTQTGEDGGGQPIYTDTLKGSVLGRIDPKAGRRGSAEVVNGPDLNPVVSDFLGITDLPVGFTIIERDTLTDTTGAYEVLGVATLDARANAHHLEFNLRRVA